MADLLSRLSVASRGDDLESWMNILFVVVLAVLWLIGGIIKAKTRKPEGRDAQEAPPRKPPQRPPARGRGLQEALLSQLQRRGKPPQRPPSRPTAPAPRREPAPFPAHAYESAAQAQRTTPSQATERLPEPELPLPTSQLQPVIDELPQLTTPLVTDLETQQAAPSPDQPTETFLADADPDELKKAILHYEILGRPLSLRDPADH